MLIEWFVGFSVFLTLILGNFVGALALQSFGIDLPTLLGGIGQ